jgi:parallel beta-helix repeat protein
MELRTSWDGEVIVVRPGKYRVRIVFNGRGVTVRSLAPDDPTVVQTTVIAGPSGSSVIFDFGEGGDSVLQGFTVTGYGIFCVGSAPTISKNIIRDCQGAGISGQSDAAPTIAGNTIVSNELDLRLQWIDSRQHHLLQQRRRRLRQRIDSRQPDLLQLQRRRVVLLRR